MVAIRGAGGFSRRHTGGVLSGGAAQAEMTGPSWSDIYFWVKGLSNMGDVQVYGGPRGSGRLVG